MCNTSPSQRRLPVVLLLAVAAFGPPSVAILAFRQAVTHNPWLIVAFIVIYELVLVALTSISKIWQRLKDTWIEAVAASLDQFLRSLFYGNYYRYYCQNLYSEYRGVDLKGIGAQGGFTINLEDAFVDLDVDPISPQRASVDPLRSPLGMSSGQHTIWEYLKTPLLSYQQFVILGAPGSGKTALLKYLALTLIPGKKHYRQRPIPQKLPLLLFLRDHSAAIKEMPEYTLGDAVRTQVSKWEHPMPPGWIERSLERGHCLVLLDGLHEVIDAAERQRVVEWMERQMIAYGKNRFVITSRPSAYKAHPLSGVTVLQIQHLTYEQVAKFVYSWYIASEIRSTVRDDPGIRMKARREAQDLLLHLSLTPSLLALAVNPLLLTMIVMVHRYLGSLPGKRVTLYREICEVFLGKRQEIEGIRQELRTDQRQRVLQTLAYYMMLRGMVVIPSAEIQQAIEQPLKVVSRDISPKQFLQDIENVSGLLVERENGFYSFAHLTIQEYLAAMHIRENRLEDALLGQVGSSWWRETILLYSAQADATSIIEVCLSQNPPSTPTLVLALECAQEALTVRADTRQRLDNVIEQGVEDADPEKRRVVAQALLARRLGQMLPVNETTYIDTSLVTCAEYQVFLDEQRMRGRYYQPDHWKASMFQPGQSRLPILGVRASDAWAFCDWLTQQDREGWRYRLPYPEELIGRNEGLWENLAQGVGYWVNGQPNFAWSSETLPLSLQEHILDALNAALAKGNLLSSQQEPMLGVNNFPPFSASDLITFDTPALTHNHNLALSRAFNLAIDLDHIGARAHDLVLELDRKLAYGHNAAFSQDYENALAPSTNLDLNLANTSMRNPDLELELFRVRMHDLALDLISTISVLFTHYPTHEKSIKQEIEHMLILALSVYLSLYLLQERAEGRFPAYEGILLVKERAFVQHTGFE